ncbi:opioid growth factor receptor-like protein 1 [Asterias amurensis]|uniref:opioid growth factor receptor-like protein 1 n=1 Tax=Asterias amurensis TaxID=7602 RepID=UPI003AB4463C
MESDASEQQTGRKRKRKINHCEEPNQRARQEEKVKDVTDSDIMSSKRVYAEGERERSQSPSKEKKKTFLGQSTLTTFFGHVGKKTPPSSPARLLQCHRDIQEYRNGYPDKEDDKSLIDNLRFYKNEIQSRPRGDFIDDIHKHWFGDYSRLEEHHGYIQWLFPIREQGMNWKSQELQQHEAKKIIASENASRRLIKSYRMMLDFWGMRLEDEKTGVIVRGDNWKERFTHLNRSYHNYMRITRMLKSLGELGQEHLKAPFLTFILQEVIKTRTLINAQKSCLNYWIHTIRDEKKRQSVLTLADDLCKKYTS